jgi:hypothetical protein
MSVDIVGIIRDVEEGRMTIRQIREKYSISAYKYNLIMKEAGIRKKYVYEQTDHSKNTPFKRLLNGSTDSADESQFDLPQFVEDCRAGVPISSLMVKYNLSLYQIRELRKKHG